MNKRIIAGALAALVSAASWAGAPEIDLEYYSPLHGLRGASLKKAVFSLVGSTENSYMYLSYGSGNRATWWGFYATDRMADNQVIDRYSNDVRYFGSRGSSVSGMNIEHSFAKSWWGGSTSPASYRDLYNLMPCEQGINSSKSNYAMGKVTSVKTTNGCTKIGSSAWGITVWEPADKWKGDFARGYMYMATAYQNLTWSSSGLNILEQNAWPTLKPEASELYIQWARQDAVNAEEVQRNQAVHEIQGNRNPFVDFPNLMEYIWGDSTDVAFDIRTTVKSAPVTGSVVDPDETWQVLYESTFLGTDGDCVAEIINNPANIGAIWTLDSQYGWKASAFKGSACESEAILYTPEIDMSSYAYGQLDFDHAVNFAADPSAVLSVVAETASGEVLPLTVNNWPAGTSWKFLNSGAVSLSRLAGERFRIGFRYTSTLSEAATWEVKNLTVKAIGKHNDIETVPDNIRIELDDNLMPAEYYSLDGMRVDPAVYRGIVIRRQGASVTKILLR